MNFLISSFEFRFKRIELGVSKQKGFSLLEVMVALGLVGIIMMTLMSLTDIMNANNRYLSLSLSRNDIVNNIRTQALFYTNIDNSALMTNSLGTGGITSVVSGVTYNLAHFDMLARCLPTLTDPTLTGCNKQTMDDPARGNLFYLSNRNSQDPATAVAGEGVYYKASGARCSAADAVNPVLCPLFSRAWYEPFCLNFATTCNKAMSLSIKYSVGIRSDYVGGPSIPTAEGEMYLPLQKGIQMSRLGDQGGNNLIANSAGIYPLQKYLGLPDQVNSPRGLRFDVSISNPTGIVTLKVQSRSITGAQAYGLDEKSIPAGLTGLPFVDVPNPLTGTGVWTIDATAAQPGQLFSFGVMTTASSTTGLVDTSFAIGSSDVNNSTYHWTKDPNNSSNFIPPTFKSGFYQFRIVATDSNQGTIESTNYITVRILPRPEILLTSPGSNPLNIQRNCITGNNTITAKYLIGDDEGLFSNSIKINGVAAGVNQISGTHGEVSLPFDLQQVSGNYSIDSTIQNFFSNKLVLGSLFPQTIHNLLVSLQEVVPTISAITGSPNIIRSGTTSTASVSLTTGSCCSQTPAVSWTYPAVPAAGGIMLSGAASSQAVCTLDSGGANQRVCIGTTNVTGIKDGPAVASPDAQSLFTFNGAPPNDAACKVPSDNYTSSGYIQVLSIPGISFYTPESLWLDFSNLQNDLGLMSSPQRKIWIKADFQPTQAATVHVIYNGSSLCAVTFPGGTGTVPMLQSCDLPSPTNVGDYVLSTWQAINIQSETAPPGPNYVAKLTPGLTTHRVCAANLSSLNGFSATMNIPPPGFSMWNSPFGTTGTSETGDTSTFQNQYNDAGHWNSGTKNLRCYERWSPTPGPGYTDGLNNQDRKYIKWYKDNLGAADTVHLDFSIPFGSFGFPNNTSSDFNSVDFNSPNIPTFFMLTTGVPGGISWKNSSTGLSTAPKPWMNRTGELCTGSSALTNLKLFSTKMEAFVGGASQPISDVLTSSTTEAYSYVFFCTYGRWNPQTPTPGWVD